QITYQQLLRQVNQCGNALKSIGVENENRLLLLLYDTPEFIVTFFGAIKIGAIPIPTNTMLSSQDYEYILNNSRAKVLVVHEDLWNKIKENRDRFAYLQHVIVISENATVSRNALDYNSLIKSASEELETFLT